MSLPSSLTNNYEQPDYLNDDDLKLAKDISLSNPITISKLKRSHNSDIMNKQVKQRKINALNGTTFDSNPHTLTKESTQKNYDSKINHEGRSLTSFISRRDLKRQLSLYSEYTNSYSTKCLYVPFRRLHNYEQKWEIKLTDVLASSLVTLLSEISDLPNSEVMNSLKKTDHGWYILNGTGKK